MSKRLLAGATTVAIGLTGLLAPAAPAQNGGGAGFDGPSRALEQSFKVALLERRKTPDGCYPAAKPLAAAIQAGTRLRVRVIGNQKKIKKRNIAYVISGRTRCNRVYIAYLGKKGLYILDSEKGPIYVVGRNGKRVRGNDAEVGGKGPLRALRLVSKTTTLSIGDEVKRETVACPKGSFPMGGGMFGTPSPDPLTREGAYPHSYERLGVQRGWHINPVLIDPDRSSVTPRTVTIQALCGRGLAPSTSPHKTVFVKPGQTKVAVARCPKGTTLYSGGFQRADFRTPSGSYPTESRKVGNGWRVTGQAFGAFGGEITSIAYCSSEKKAARVREVSASTPVLLSQFAEATTPACPRKTKLVSGGFSSQGATGLFADGGHYNRNGTWTAGAFGYFGPAASFTAYGYCARG